MTDKKGLFLTIEGIDGCGKTTATTMLFEQLQERGLNGKVQQVSTFHTSGWTTHMRSLLTSDKHELSNDTLLLMMLDVHTYNYYNHIKPLVDKGFIVIVDRSIISTMVFQLSQGLKDIDTTIAYQHLLSDRVDIMPQMTILVDVDPSIARHRLSLRENSGCDRIEAQSIDKHMEYRKEYQRIIAARGSYNDIIVTNTGTIADLKRQMDSVATIVASSID